MEDNLQGMSVLVTRPLPQGLALCQQIESHLGKAHYFPTITFIPAVDAAELKTSFEFLADHDWIIFVSPRAVGMSRACLQSILFSTSTHFAAVGAGTARALEKLGKQVVYPKTLEGSEGLLALDIFQDVEDKKVGIVRGAGGRDLLSRVLKERGANVTEIVAYERAIPVVSPTHYLSLCREKKISAIVCASYEGVVNFKKLMGEDGWTFIKSIPLIVVSDRIRQLAEKIGFSKVKVSNGTSHHAVIQTLAELHYEQ